MGSEKLYEYQGILGRLHEIRDAVRERWQRFNEENPQGLSRFILNKCFHRKDDRSGLVAYEDYSHIYR